MPGRFGAMPAKHPWDSKPSSQNQWSWNPSMRGQGGSISVAEEQKASDYNQRMHGGTVTPLSGNPGDYRNRPGGGIGPSMQQGQQFGQQPRMPQMNPRMQPRFGMSPQQGGQQQQPGGGLNPKYRPPVPFAPMNPEQRQGWYQSWQDNQANNRSMIGDLYGSANPGPGGITGEKLYDWQQQGRAQGPFIDRTNRQGSQGPQSNNQFPYNPREPYGWGRKGPPPSGQSPYQEMPQEEQGGIGPSKLPYDMPEFEGYPPDSGMAFTGGGVRMPNGNYRAARRGEPQ